ncbi:hypothetical protein [Modestobacter italicus]|uniref:hypothetical protein n=1 Tax=Modestobacter italicus (strain DSM 44449 / CECT 9708 / BC 501) TaxID=2732864 RepID=UPI001C9789E3|nr:hypothetical protein [Modestobacter italicus]
MHLPGEPSAEPTAPQPRTEGCLGERSEPDPERPVVVEMAFSLSDDRRTAPPARPCAPPPTCRPTSWSASSSRTPGTPARWATGSRSTQLRGADVAAGHESAQAAAPGWRYVVALAEPLGAGESTEVAPGLTLRPGEADSERVETAQDVSWFGSGVPLLARSRVSAGPGTPSWR